MILSFMLRRALCGAVFAFSLSTGAYAQDGTAPVNNPVTPSNPATPSTTPPPPTDAPEEEAAPTGFAFGADLYYGTSNAPDAHRFRDGYWLGYGAFYPSNFYTNYNSANGTSGRVSVGVGKLYNGSVPGFDQPIEAYVSKPFGKTTVTAGKFFVPFELSEWVYESEWGLQAARDWGKNDHLTAAVTYNRFRETPNFYARYSRNFGSATIGASLGGGTGFVGDTDHDRGGALDFTLTHRRFRLEGVAELFQQKNAASSRFLFAFARLNYHLDPKTNIYISRHSWFDRLDQQSNGQFSTVGAAYQVTKNLSIEGALSRSGEANRTINFIQLHYTFER
ncbi:hypothetical protein EON83_22025 [bacterium]|nr:MAG: hypothetical protein EON83_22025 [bacterium]